MKSLRQIVFLLAASITLLHAILPHIHEEEVGGHVQEFRKAQNVIDYLQLGLHINQGFGHLEHISAVQKINLDKTNNRIVTQTPIHKLVFVSNFDSFYLQDSQKQNRFSNQNELLPNPLRIRSNSLRAPPLFS